MLVRIGGLLSAISRRQDDASPGTGCSIIGARAESSSVYSRVRMHLYLAAPVAAALVLIAGTAAGQAVPVPSPSAPLIAANDNRRAAGGRFGNELRLQLVVNTGRWQPEGPDGRTLLVQAFREEGEELTSPGPLVRVPAGTEIVVSIRNNLREPVSVFGFVTLAARERR